MNPRQTEINKAVETYAKEMQHEIIDSGTTSHGAVWYMFDHIHVGGLMMDLDPIDAYISTVRARGDNIMVYVRG